MKVLPVSISANRQDEFAKALQSIDHTVKDNNIKTLTQAKVTREYQMASVHDEAAFTTAEKSFLENKLQADISKFQDQIDLLNKLLVDNSSVL